MRLTEIRKQAGISQQRLAKELKYSQNAISQWENGFRDPGTDTLIALADFFNVSVDYLLGREWECTFNFAQQESATTNDKHPNEEIFELYEKLPKHKQELILEVARAMLENTA